MIRADAVQPMPDEGLSVDAPLPLTRTVQVPPFPVDALPGPIAAMVEAVAEATQTDPAMAGTSALAALAACTGGHAEIEVRHGWREPLCLYTATVAGPGERKSAVQATMVRPILDVEQRLAAAGAAARLEAETRRQVAVAEAEQLRRKAVTAADDFKDAAMADAIGAAALAESITVPVIPRLVADDITPEAAASLLADQNGRLAIISAEGGVFDIIAGRYSHIPNLDLWLKGHSGDPLKVDRKGRAPEYIPSPALTLALMIQPSVLTTIAGHREFRGRGLLARFLYALPKSKVGRRKIAPAPVTPSIAAQYEKVLAELASGMAQWAGDPAVLVLTEAAHTGMVLIEEAIEPTLAGSGELAPLADWGAKHAGAIARIAGILHLAEHGPEAGPTSEPVTAETIRAAARIGAYFRAAAINAFAEMGTDPATADALYLLNRIRALGETDVSERDMLRAAQKFNSRAELLPAMERLIEHGHLVSLPAPETSTGRPPSPRYRVADRTDGTDKNPQ